MSETLANFYIDIEELVDDLRYHWEAREDEYNANAFSRVKKTGENLMFCCPYHDETRPSAGLKTDYPYGFHCFGCGSSANLYQLVAHTLRYNSELLGEHYIIKNYVTTSVLERNPIDMDELLDERGQSRRGTLHEGDIKKYLAKRHSYMYRRGFNDLTLDKYEVGYDSVTDAVTFPVRTSKGDIRFIKRRFVSKKGFLNQAGIDKKDIIYGLYYINRAPTRIDTLFLNESETDTMACYQSRLPAGAILGRILFKEQVRELLRTGIKTVNLFFDNDKHGVECTLKAYSLLSSTTPIRVNVVIYPGGHFAIDGVGEMIHKDANDLLKANKMKDIQVVPAEQYLSMIKFHKELDTGYIFKAT